MAVNPMPAKPKTQSASEFVVAGCTFALLGFLIATLLSFVVAWPVMVLLGVLASWTGWPVAIGYWTTWLILLIVRLVIPGSNYSSSS